MQFLFNGLTCPRLILRWAITACLFPQSSSATLKSRVDASMPCRWLRTRQRWGPGLQEAVRTFSNAMQKLPTMLIRNPTMYALADPALVGSL